jgi:hypothetical protein
VESYKGLHYGRLHPCLQILETVEENGSGKHSSLLDTATITAIKSFIEQTTGQRKKLLSSCGILTNEFKLKVDHSMKEKTLFANTLAYFKVWLCLRDICGLKL